MSARRRARRALLVLVTTVLVVGSGTTALVAAWLAGVRVPVASGAVWLTVEKLDTSGSADVSRTPSDPFYLLLVGNDERPGVTGRRGDALHVVGVNPVLGQATIVNIPRDVCAPVPGSGTTKINNAHSRGGPRLQADVLGDLLGVHVSYAVSVNFAGFQALVDGVGGVEVDVPFAMDDPYSGAHFAPGPMHMNGVQALAFSRDRHDFPIGDIQRTDNQGYLIWSAFRQLQADAAGPTGQLRALALLGRHAQLDGVGLRDLYHLGRLALRIDPARVRNVTPPVASGGGCAGGLTHTAAGRSLIADFADDAVLQTH